MLTCFALFFLTVALCSNPLYAFQSPTPTALQQQGIQANTLMLNGQYREAYPLLESLWKAYRATKNTRMTTQYREESSAALVWRSDWSFSQKKTQLEAIRSNLHPDEGDAFYHSTLAHLLAQEGTMDQVAEHCQRAQAFFAKRQELYPAAYLYMRIAYACYDYQLLDSALHYLRQAEALNPRYEQTFGTTIPSLHNLQTVVYSALGQYERALKGALADIAILQQDATNQRELTYEYNNLASLYHSLGDHNNAIIYYKKALKIHEDLLETDTLEWAICHHNLSTIYLDIHRAPSAQTHMLQGLSLLQRMSGANTAVQTALIDLYQNASYLYLSQSTDSARHYLDKAQRIQQHLPYRKSVTYHHLGAIHQQQGQLRAALKYYTLALEEHQRIHPQSDKVVQAWLKIASLQQQRHQYTASLEAIQQAFQVITNDYQPRSLYDCPDIQQFIRLSLVPDLLRHHIRTLQLSYQQKPHPAALTGIYHSTQLATQALEKLNRSLTNVHSKRAWLNEMALPFFETAIGVSLDLAQQTSNPHYRYKALELAEHSQCMLMMDARSEQQAARSGGVPDSLLQRYQQAQYQLRQAQKERTAVQRSQNSRKIAQAEERIFQCQHQLDRLLYQLEQNYPAYRAAKYQLQNSDPYQLQAQLHAQTVLVEFFEGRRSVFSFCLTADSLYTHRFERTPAYNQQLQQFIHSLSDIKGYQEAPIKTYDAFAQTAHALYQQLLLPILPYTPKRLLLVPDGRLSYLPFEVLLTDSVAPVRHGRAIDGDFSALPYLLRQSTVHYLFSGSLWLEQCKATLPEHGGRILGFAPNYEGSDPPPWRQQRERQLRARLYDLEGAALEVAHLSSQYNGYYLTARDATERAFKDHAAQYGILHLALHGLVDTEDPQYSGLALAENADSLEDNFLYLYEIQQLALHTNLVVLSACETGTGHYQRGEGVVSLGRGFVYAGAPALVTTLWSLNDHSGAMLMEEFYRHLSAGACKDEAMRQAKLYYLDEYMQEIAHPHLWAAFVTVGDYNPIVVEPISYKKYYLSISVAFLLIIAALVYRYTQKK